MNRRAVYLDRDGVLNRAIVRDGKPYPPSGLDELEILPGVPQALTRLNAAGYRLVVVTNQPDVGRGTMAPETVAAVHARGKLHVLLASQLRDQVEELEDESDMAPA